MHSTKASVLVTALSILLGSACNVSTTRRMPLPDDDEPVRRSEGKPIRYEHANDAPEISRSVGQKGGVVVLWPRIIPKSEDPAITDLALRVQSRLARIAEKSSSNIDRRPAPERVCPRGEGCQAVSVGAVLAVKDKGCAVIAVVGPPGTGNVSLVPLAGSVTLRSASVPFRDPPESEVTVQEFVPCEKLLSDLEQNVTLEGEERVGKAVQDAK